MKLGWLRGPRLGTKLMLLGLALLIVPWFSFRQLVQMESFLVQGQSQAQLLTAEGISTLLNGREELFDDLPLATEAYEALYAHPLDSAIRIDGQAGDWEALAEQVRSFGAQKADRTSRAPPDDGSFDLVLGERRGQLYVFMRVRDDSLVYRNPDSLRLDNADHIRLKFSSPTATTGRIQISLLEPGVTTAYHMDSEWKLAADGQPENRVQGYMVETEQGYNVEFRVPLAMLGAGREFGISVVDVDDPESREIRNITQTLPEAGRESFNLVVLRSPEVLDIIEGLGYAGARILVIDARKRVRAETGNYQAGSVIHAPIDESKWVDWLYSQVRPLFRNLFATSRSADSPIEPEQSVTFGEKVIESSLNGRPRALRRRLPNGEEIIMAAHPIISEEKIIGTVVVEQNTSEILELQRIALERTIVVAVASLLAIFIALLAFSVHLAWRIRTLGAETTEAIDQHGRLRTGELRSAVDAGDEIGDLARSVSNMLAKLHQHNQFLENMPRTLRHEINNPLNTLSTSLQNLEQEHPSVARSKYLESAKRGVLRIGAIVQNLADAASLEESLEAEELELVDIEELLENYVTNCRTMHPECTFVFQGNPYPLSGRLADYRSEQMLYKIIDNAVDFHRAGTPIRIHLRADRDQLVLSVRNQGPILPPEREDSLFDSMVTHRAGTRDNRLHFGLGLYVVRVIVEHHGGVVRAQNLPDESGVVVEVTLPRAEHPRLRANA